MMKSLVYNKLISEYIQELSKLVKVKINEADLTNIEFVHKIKCSIISRNNAFKVKTLFANKNLLAKAVNEICKIDKKVVYVFTDYSNSCGVLPINNICEFNVEFTFLDEHAGIISLVSQNLENEMILDFWEENGEEWIEIEINGSTWPQIQRVVESE